MSSSTTSGTQPLGLCDGLGAVSRLSDDVEALRLEQRRRGLTERLVVVDDQNRPAHGAILPEVAGGRMGLATVTATDPCDHVAKTVANRVSVAAPP